MPKLLTLFTLLLLLSACVDQIDLTDGEPLPDGIVFQGRLNAEGETADVQVRLERLFRFSESNRPDRVATADVTLENSEGQSVGLSLSLGAYRASFPEDDPDFIIRPGVGYRIRARVGEERYLTEFDVLPEPLQIGELTTEYGLEERETPAGGTILDSVVRYRIDAPIVYPDGRPAFIRYTSELLYKVTDTPLNGPNRGNSPKACYVTTVVDGSEVRLVSAQNTTATRLDDFLLASRFLNSEFAEGTVLTVYQEVISREAFEYFDQIGRISSTEASIFEPPGGPVVGNARDENGLTDNVFGYFYAANRTLARVAVSPEEANFPTDRCPMPPSMSPSPSPTSCDDCLTIPRSVDVRPDFFPF